MPIQSDHTFDYSPSFRQRIVELHRGKESWPNYEKYLSDHLGGPDSRLAWFATQLCPEIEYRCGALEDKRVLDFGCGTGSATAPLAARSRRVCAFDIDRESLDICRQRIEEHRLGDKAEFVWAPDLLDACGRMGTFDLILVSGVLEHIPLSKTGLRRQILRALFNMLNDGGHLYIHDTPNRVWPIDVHSTQLWWIPWMPAGSRLAYRLAVSRGRHTPAPTISEGPLGLEEVGAWGCTYWEITKALDGLEFVPLNTVDGSDRRVHYGRDQGWRRALAERAAYYLAVKLLRVPITAFAPFLTNLVIQRSSSRGRGQGGPPSS
jgi:2-polyprenyl-3-methyl-5-hydroxy-6-metoxy-1,4-benzoquinol methylase